MKNVIAKAGGWLIWGLILILALNLAKDIGRTRDINRQISEEKQKIAKIEADNSKLEAELKNTQSVDFLEKEVRDKLGLGREGEAMVVLPDPDTLKKLAPEIKFEEEVLPDPNWKKWLKLFI